MKIGSIDNNAHNTLDQFLQSTAKNAVALDMGSAFITNAGLNSVNYLLTGTAQNGKVRILTGFYNYFTEPSALRALLKIQTQTQGRLEVRVSRSAHYHWKSYFIFTKSASYAVVGSSNLTGDGLSTDGEFNLTVSVPKKSSELNPIHQVFEKNWKHESVELTKSIIDRYEFQYKKYGKLFKSVRIPLKQILGKQKARSQQAESIKAVETRFFRASLKGACDKSTVKYLSEKKSSWDKKGYSYFSQAKSFQIGDEVVLFDFTENRIKLVRIVDTIRTPNRTPDGIYFAAYKMLKRVKIRKWTKSRRASLKSDGLIKSFSDADSERKLSAKKFLALIENLKKTV